MKKLFNFYLDEDVKQKCTKKLNELFGQATKGALAAYFRVCAEELLEEGNPERLAEITSKVVENYMESTYKNKRSVL